MLSLEGLKLVVERLLAGSSRGMTVESLRSVIVAGGTPVAKDQVVIALDDLRRAAIAECGLDRRWRLRRSDAAAGGSGGDHGGGEVLRALPAHVLDGAPASPEEPLPEGRLRVDADLIARLMPYWRAALRASDGGDPVASLGKNGRSFVLVRPDAPWWPIEGRGRVLRIRRDLLPDAFLEALARHDGKTLRLGYPLQLVAAEGEGTEPFLRPIATLRGAFSLTDTALLVSLPPARPTLNADWLKGQRRSGRWSADRLRSWLLFEDESADVHEEDEVAPAGFVDMAAFARRLDAAMRTSLAEPLEPSAPAPDIPAAPRTAIHNAIVLSLDEAGKYTRSAIADYDRLIGRDGEGIAETALASLVDEGATGAASPPPPVLHPFALSESQLVATRAALDGPLAVITGPPGTGKSQLIAAFMVSAAAAGKSVLFAARQHRALDAVQERLHAVCGERALLVRANDGEGVSSVTFARAVQALLARPDGADAGRRLAERLAAIASDDRERWRLIDAHREIARLSDEAAAARLAFETALAERERLLAEAQAKGVAPPPPATSWLRRLRARLAALFVTGPAVGTARALAESDRSVAAHAKALAAREMQLRQARAALARETGDPVALSERIAEATRGAMPALLDALESVDANARRRLTELAGEAGLKGNSGPGRLALPADAAGLVLKHLPLWAVTTLAAGSRIPLTAGLFDYVVFDEAAQTDIASAVPLLYRAKKAVVVGDPQQLAMITDLDAREERDLLRAHDLLRPGIGRFAQGRTSLFDLAASSPQARRHLLAEHFRSHPAIADYINEAFYGRRLTTLTDTRALRVPAGARPGLHWSDVTGPMRVRAGAGSRSAASDAEADAVVSEIERLIAQGYAGTIGVVTIFELQAQAIAERIARAIPPEERTARALKVFTANRFQGDERDVVFLSLCLSADTPPGARHFLASEKRLLNVAVSRARAICHVVGDLAHCEKSGIPHVEALVRQWRRGALRVGGGQAPRADDRFDSIWERRLHDALVARGLSPIPQYPIAGRFLDLALVDEEATPPLRLDIEVDGVAYHQGADGERRSSDLWRDYQLRSLGWRVLRFWVYELRDDMEGCVDRIIAEARG